MRIRAYLEPICERIGVDLGVYVWQRICIRITAYMHYVLYYRQSLSADISQYMQSLRAYIHYRAILYRACGIYSIWITLWPCRPRAWRTCHSSVLYILLYCILYRCLRACIKYYTYYMERILPCRPRVWRIKKEKKSVKKKGSQLSHIIHITWRGYYLAGLEFGAYVWRNQRAYIK